MPDSMMRPKFHGDVFFRGTSTTYDFFYDASAGAWLPSTDDFVVNRGNGTLSFDERWYGNIATAYEYKDASASEIRNFGPMRLTSHRTCLSKRFELVWTAGQRGKPGINGDIESGTEA